MKTKDYLAAALERVNPDRTATCEDCGRRSMVSHLIVDHDQDTVKTVCQECFMKGYKDLLYSDQGPKC